MSWEAWGTPDYMDWEPCPHCQGDCVEQGEFGEQPCSVCGGTGEQEPPAQFDDDVI